MAFLRFLLFHNAPVQMGVSFLTSYYILLCHQKVYNQPVVEACVYNILHKKVVFSPLVVKYQDYCCASNDGAS